MKKQIFLVVLAAGLAAVSGCAEKKNPVPGVRITPAIKTRVTGLHFDTGDQIGLTITKGSGNYVENHPMTYQGSTFSGSGLIWYNDLNEKSTLTAYYPYSAAGVSAGFSVVRDQTAGCGSSDLLGAVKTDVVPASTPVGMLFYHLMSQLTIVVTNNSDASVSGLTVGGLVPTAEVDLTVPTASAKAGVAAEAIKAFEVTPDASYRVILVPQQAALTVTVETRDGKSRSKTIPSARLESGKQYDMSVLVTNIDIELTLSGDISDWGDGGSLDGDEGGGNGGGNDDGGDVSELVYGGVTYRTAKIGDRIWMAENLRYMPAGAALGSGVWNPEKVSAAEGGLLYDYTTATGGDATRAGTPLRGICPDGWHIPDTAELQALVASADRPVDFLSCAGYWIAANDRYGDSLKGYLMGSETPEAGRCSSLSYSEGSDPAAATVLVGNGISVRCVKNAAVR